MQLQTEKAHAWMVFLGHDMPIHDHRRKVENFEDKYKKRVREYKSPFETKSFATRRLLRGIKVCLNAGIESNDVIYEVMAARGFLNRLDGKVMTKHTLRSYALAVRNQLGIVRKAKKTTKIKQMYLAGKSVKEIAFSIETTVRYVNQALKRQGLNNE